MSGHGESVHQCKRVVACIFLARNRTHVQGILQRGVGKKDGFTADDMTIDVIKKIYKLSHDTTKENVLKLTEKWHPYSMWVVTLMHVWMRASSNMSSGTFNKNKAYKAELGA